MFVVKIKAPYTTQTLGLKCKFGIIFLEYAALSYIENYIFQVHASMAVFWYLDDIVLDWIGQTGPGLGAKVIETRGKVKFSSSQHLLRVK